MTDFPVQVKASKSGRGRRGGSDEEDEDGGGEVLSGAVAARRAARVSVGSEACSKERVLVVYEQYYLWFVLCLAACQAVRGSAAVVEQICTKTGCRL